MNMNTMCGSGYLSTSFPCGFIVDPNFITKYSRILRESSMPSRHNGRCLVWQSSRDISGYGHINIQIDGQCKNWRAHRLAYLLFYNLQPCSLNDKDVSHLCHNPACIEPSHLSLEDRETNNQRKCCVHSNFCQKHYPYADCMLYLKFTN